MSPATSCWVQRWRSKPHWRGVLTSSSTNRQAADRRLLELAGEREKIEQKLDGLKHLALSAAQAREVVEHTARFISGLKATLTEAPLDQRQAAIRRCVDNIVIEFEGGKARL